MEIQFQSNLISNLNIKPIVDLRGVIPVNPAYTWEQLCGNRNPNTITTIVVHHDALPKYKFVGVSDVELASRIANGHIGNKQYHEKGDPGFPYDIWIRSGQAYLCNDLLPLKYGVPSNNGYTIHVCVSGEYKYTDGMTDDDRTTLIAVIFMLQNIDELPNLRIIKGHGEITPTDCPGINMDLLRNDVLNTKIRIDANNTTEARRGYAYLVSQQTQYMYSMINKNDGNEQWALSFFDKFYGLMRAEGWFK